MNSIPLQELLEYQPVVYCAIDRNGSFSYINQSTADVLGYQPHELIGAPFLNFVVEQDREKSQFAIQQIYQGKYLEKFENRYYHRNGSVVTLQWSSHWSAKDQMVYGIAHSKYLHDEVVQLQQAFSLEIKQKSSKLSETLDQLPDAFLTIDDQWRIIYANKASEQLFFITKELMLANEIWEVFPAAIGSIIETKFKKCLKQQIQVRFETYFSTPINKWFEISAHPSTTGISVLFRDITERKHVEEEMRKLSLIVKHTDNLVTLCNCDGSIKWVNDAFINTTGYKLHEALGLKPGDLLSGPLTDIKKIQSIRKRYLNGEGFNEELLYYKKNGEPFWVYVSGRIIFDEDGQVKELFSIQTDITERKQLEEELEKERETVKRKTTAAVIQAQEEERSVIGRDLHDNVNQLLTTVKLYLEVSLSPNMDKKDLTVKSIKLIQDSINEIRNISKQLSAPTIGNITLDETVNDLCTKIAATKPFKLIIDTSAIEELNIDQEIHLAIYRIIQEHITNILKHASAKSVHLVLDFKDEIIKLMIIDDGKGFDTNGKRDGIGITNMITRAESINGRLTICSELNKGCVLKADFPINL